MTATLATRLADIETELIAYRTEIAAAHRILDAAGVGERGAGLHIRVAALCEQVRNSTVQHASMDDERLAAITARLANYYNASASQDMYVAALGGAAYQLLQHAPADIRVLLDEVSRLRTLMGGQADALTRQLGILKSENESLRAQLAILRGDEPARARVLDDAMDTIAALRAELARVRADERRPHLGEM